MESIDNIWHKELPKVPGLSHPIADAVRTYAKELSNNEASSDAIDNLVNVTNKHTDPSSHLDRFF